MKTFGLAEYGGDELLIALIACGLLAFALFRLYPPLALLPAIPLGIVIWFFRDPDRRGPENPEQMLSPADGTVTDIVELDEPRFIGGRAMRIGIFLSPFNVHVNRSPCDGTVKKVEFRSGEFLPAYNPQAPERNESTALGMELDSGLRIVVKQITGVLARRIICEVDAGEKLTRGQRYGMIKFGSRTELYIPIDACGDVRVKIGDKVVGGATPLCDVKEGVRGQGPGVSNSDGAIRS